MNCATKQLKQQIQMVKEKMDDKFNRIISMIQRNYILTNVKPEVLFKK